jgi:serine/threonine-protein kinase
MKQAQLLDPVSPIIVTNTGTVLYLARRYDEAIRQFDRALELDPGFTIAHCRRAFAYARKGMLAPAIQDLEQVRQRDESNWLLMTLGYIYGLSGDRGRARGILAELQRRYRQGRSDAHSIRFVYQGLDDKNGTLDWLEKEYNEHSTGMIGLNVSPDYDSLRGDPRFQDLLRRIGLVDSITIGKSTPKP